ncbi:MAG: FAD-dependent monooxygenase [Yaniella sp.]|nr:FAD-dependent monooxygenase [Yaniella sp.]
MQYHLNGYTFGDPSVAAAAPEHIRKDAELPETVDVLVVGTGPAGAVLTAQLAQYPELSVATVDRRGEPLARGHADGVACRTVEMFEAFGLADTLVREALWVNETAFWSVENPGDGITRTGLVQDVADGLSEFPHVIVNQARMQELLFDVAAKSPSRFEVDYGWQYVSQTIDESEEHPVEVTLEATAQEHAETTRTLRAKYVVGCDGARSAVRESVGRQLHGDVQNHAWGVMDVLLVTDFPDIRKKAVISSDAGSIILIPREGGYLVRLYVDLGAVPEGDTEFRKRITVEQVTQSANKILDPYSIEVREVAWWSIYEVGQRIADGFDNLNDDERADRQPRIFIAGDACHTHSAKAGQGMNVSMQDTFNLGWKLGAVLSGQAKPELLHTYSEERKVTAQELIDYDIRWSKMVGSRDADQPVTPDEVEEQFVRGGQFTAGLATRYTPDFSTLTGPDTHQDLAAGFEIGTRFHSSPVIRVADAKPLQLGHVHRADGRWRVYLFADTTGLTEGSAVANWCERMSTDTASAIKRFTPEGADMDSVFDVYAVTQQSHTDVDINAVPKLVQPAKGKFALTDYEKVFSAEKTNGSLLGNIPGLEATQDMYDLREIDRNRGAVVIVRPDQYIGHVLPLDEFEAFDNYFATFLHQAR